VSAAPTAPVDAATLALGHQLGQGGQGSVHQVLNKRINESAADGGWEVVYKEYSPSVLPQLDAAALDAAAALPGRLSSAEGRWLCEKTAWPAAVVQRQGQACGFLMRSVPDRFHFTLQTLTSANTSTRRLATMEYLLNDDAYITGIGLAVSDRHRLLLLADLAGTLERLHRIGINVGDLSPKNLLFSLAPEPACFLIDCDATRLHGATVLPQAETPDWQVPTGEELATRASDVYKLALLAVRIFAHDQTATDPAALATISPALGDLARTSLDPDPAQRPTLGVWAEQVASAVVVASTSTKPRKNLPHTGRPSGRPGGAGRPPTTTGTPKPSTTAAARAAKVLGTLAAALVLLMVIVNNLHSSQSDATGTTDGGQPSVSAVAVPSDTWTPSPDPTTDSPVPESTTDSPFPDPTTYSPLPEPTTATPAAVVPPPPPTYYYGAIAVSQDGSDGRSWDAGSQATADELALANCPRSNCKILVRFVNSCGAVAYNPQTNMYWGGSGATAVEAEGNAIAHAGGGHWIVYVCTTR
jgi:serine/threonine protein kinase